MILFFGSRTQTQLLGHANRLSKGFSDPGTAKEKGRRPEWATALVFALRLPLPQRIEPEVRPFY